VQIPASYWLVQERDKRLFGLSLSVLSNIVAAVAPDDAVADLKNAAIDCVSRRDFLCGGRRLVIVNFQHQRQPIKRDLATRKSQFFSLSRWGMHACGVSAPDSGCQTGQAYSRTGQIIDL
jgi:hypothetical protein